MSSTQSSPAPASPVLWASALRECLREGYGRQNLKQDILAGLVVGIVALPLSMALSIAVGAPPQHGLYTAIVAGFIAALTGGSRTQVTGPTAAFVVILTPILSSYGMAGLLISGILAGLILIAMGLMRFGRLIEFIPHPVTTGFTAGIAVVIAVFQLKDFLGLSVVHATGGLWERILEMWDGRGTISYREMGVGGATLLSLILIARYFRKIPAPLVVLPIAALVVWILEQTEGGFAVATIHSRFSAVVGGKTIEGIPQLPPLLQLPWTLPGPDGQPFTLSLEMLRSLLPSAFAIAMLGAIESLLSAVVADGLVRTRHNPDAELVGQGLANVVAPFFGGIPATGAIARTATNIRSGGRSPVASMVHALTVLTVVLALAPLIGHLPMASLAALLLVVAWNMADVHMVRHMVRVAPRSDVLVLLICFGLTVVFDMVVAVTVGMGLAAFLFMQRMSGLTRTQLISEAHPDLDQPLPPGVVVYDIDGPLFFGAAQRAVTALHSIRSGVRVVVFDMEGIPMIDATGLVALGGALERLEHDRIAGVLYGLQKQPARLIRKGGLLARYPHLAIVATLSEALEKAKELL